LLECRRAPFDIHESFEGVEKLLGLGRYQRGIEKLLGLGRCQRGIEYLNHLVHRILGRASGASSWLSDLVVKDMKITNL